MCNFYKPLLSGHSLLTDTWEGLQGVRLIEVSLQLWASHLTTGKSFIDYIWLQNRNWDKLTYLSWVLRGLEPATLPYSWDYWIIRESWHIMWRTGFKKSKGQQLTLCKSMNSFTIPELSFYSSKLNSIHRSFMTALIDSLLNAVTCYWKD